MNNEKLEAGLASDLNRELDVWKPLETAPKTETVLVYDKRNEKFSVAYWSKKYGGTWFIGCFEFISDESMVVWKKLPDKPNNI
jgi:hypothetical protein